MIRYIHKLLILAIVSLSVSPKLYAQETVKAPSFEKALNLKPEDCALFVWVGNQSRLQFISTSRDRVAYSALKGGKHVFISPNDQIDKFGQYQNQDIRNEKGQILRLRLDDPVDFSDLMLYKSGIITLPTSDGWDRIESVQAVSVCNRLGSDTVISRNETSLNFVLPSWLETPMQLSLTKKQTVRSKIIEKTPAELKVLGVSYSASSSEIENFIATETHLEVNEQKSVTHASSKIDTPYSVQLGAFPSEALAQKGWAKLQKEAEYLQTQQPIFQIANIKELGLVYRLRLMGFPDQDSAVKFCARLKSDNLECFVPQL